MRVSLISFSICATMTTQRDHLEAAIADLVKCGSLERETMTTSRARTVRELDDLARQLAEERLGPEHPFVRRLKQLRERPASDETIFSYSGRIGSPAQQGARRRSEP